MADESFHFHQQPTEQPRFTLMGKRLFQILQRLVAFIERISKVPESSASGLQ